MKSTTYTLTGTTKVIDRYSILTPASIALTSSDATRKIELSFDGGTVYHDAATILDFSAANQLVLGCQAPWTNCKVTGVTNDTVTIITDNK